ncbi:hypothetical protein FA95DRAFT_775923 [Auriscalpium vulgare]|uniref:Uncharacterized protein n=1 Tax=Auriscalpium vulgare TaxID=40419 RepID=A0ACB8S1V8_9AGAM|nr:hypothetical protein FA95DRAFT_775923 [Auriscalpium vulgare]
MIKRTRMFARLPNRPSASIVLAVPAAPLSDTSQTCMEGLYATPRLTLSDFLWCSSPSWHTLICAFRGFNGEGSLKMATRPAAEATINAWRRRAMSMRRRRLERARARLRNTASARA